MPNFMPDSELMRVGVCLFTVILAPACLAQWQPGTASTTTLGPAALTLTAFEDQADPVPAEITEWRFELTAWAWLMGLDGTSGVRGRTTDVSANFIDIADASDSLAALSGRLELGYGRLGAFVDAFYADLGVDDVSGPVGLARIDITYKQTIVDFGVMYRLAEWPLTDAGLPEPRNATLDLYAGGRYSNVELEFDPANAASLSGDEDWLDPIIGAKLVLPLEERWRFMINGDVGGFGVASDFTWSATAVIGYDFELFGALASVLLGYRAIGWDFSDGSGEDRFTWDVVQHGPMIGLTIRF